MFDIAPSPNTPRYAFTVADEVHIDGQQYRYLETRGKDHLFVPADGNGVVQAFNNSQIARLLDKGKFQHRPAPSSQVMTVIPSQMLSLFSKKEKARAEFREALVLAFFELYQEGKVKKTDASIREAEDSITVRATKIMKETRVSSMASTSQAPDEFGPRSLRRWVKAYERFGIVALYDNVSARGNRDPRLMEDERFLMYSKLPGYMCDRKKTPANIVEDVRSAFTLENRKREEHNSREADKNKHKPLLDCPSRTTIRAAIRQLDPFRLKLTREGKDAARRAFSPVGAGIDVERPLQRVEMDEQKIDLVSLMSDAGFLQMLTVDDRRALGLDDAKKRWWMTVALCVRTRCILGMTLSRTPTAQSGLRTLEMCLRDKGVWANAADAQQPWDQSGMIGTLVTDCGKHFVGHEFRARAHDLGINVLHTPAAAPWLKPYIERVFRTFSTKLMPRLSGCTFGDIIRKGESNPKKKAALSVEALCAVLVRWIVDVYHNTEHEGLDRETPLACWRRLTDLYGVTPPPSLPLRRLVFGEEFTRTIKKDGVTVLGVRYHSRKLAEHMIHSHDRDIDIRWYPEDIGAIWAKIGGEWTSVGSVHKRFHGVHAQQWLIARRELRARHAHEAEFKMSIVQEALDFVERTNSEAMARIGMVLPDWSKERVEREEQALFVGFDVQDDDEDEVAGEPAGTWGSELPTAGSGESASVSRDVIDVGNAPSFHMDHVDSHGHDPLPSTGDDGGDDDGELLPLWDK